MSFRQDNYVPTSLVAQTVKASRYNAGDLDSIPVSIAWRRKWHPTSVLLPGKSHGQRSLAGCSPWGCEESDTTDTTERLHFHFSLSCIGEGNGNPLQYPCLENSMGRGAWQAAVHGVAELDTTERLHFFTFSRLTKDI